MKHAVTIICSICLFISGILLSINNEALMSYKTARAAPPVYSFVDKSQLPLDLQLGSTNAPTIVRDTIHDTIPLEVATVSTVRYRTRTKLIIQKDTVNHKTDTLYVPVMQVNVPLRKEELNDTTHHYIHYVDTCVVKSNNSIR